MQNLSLIALLVRDYDEAIAWYTQTLGFTLIEDTLQSSSKRWVVIAPPGSSRTRLLLARADGPAQEARIGDQAGGRVFLFLETDDLTRDYAAMTAKGVRFPRPPKNEVYGVVAVGADRPTV